MRRLRWDRWWRQHPPHGCCLAAQAGQPCCRRSSRPRSLLWGLPPPSRFRALCCWCRVLRRWSGGLHWCSDALLLHCRSVDRFARRAPGPAIASPATNNCYCIWTPCLAVLVRWDCLVVRPLFRAERCTNRRALPDEHCLRGWSAWCS